MCNDQSLWKHVTLSGNKVRPTLIQQILENGCEALILKSVWIPPGHDIVKFPEVSKLKLLLFSNCRIQQDFTKKMLESCHSLQKLALLGCILDPEILRKICHQNGQSLQVGGISKKPKINK